MTPSEIRAHALEINDNTVKLLKDSGNAEAVTLVNAASLSAAMWEIAAQLAESNAPRIRLASAPLKQCPACGSGVEEDGGFVRCDRFCGFYRQEAS